ncbi:3-hydroxyacyl-CoA dehydrogenase [Microbacterium faecale]|uniref:3-hydroxyacyl-CoA dehydrogenase n=1 Tax=Microbacterium faecale TaxID=1804630 RepID=A0A916YE12_9MICO|nr:SDR family NAD(P)-dependent oxidoreductase [Microbacterium faecale]GGD40921.1 3-hydroxyacyl-CoA dehydrogenase [Microbacterium faecale]HJB63119.1 SDR family NAD(P)-dependent oxidoreductase [Candidatus Microbacterium pullistercoris]
MRIAGSHALISGGASGLGRATAERLVAGGARVFLLDLPGSAGAEVANEIGGGARFVPGDVTDVADVRAAVDAASAGGSLRIVVNCAGVATPGKLLGRDGPLPLESFMRTVTVNLGGTVNLAAQAAEAIAQTDPIDGERGVIVNTASIAAFEGQIGQIAYGASKGGVVGFTLPAARELARHLIRVVTIAPGLFETPMMASLPAEVQESLGSKTPHPSRLGMPTEYAALVEHIAQNPMLNGETIRLDGAVRLEPS